MSDYLRRGNRWVVLQVVGGSVLCGWAAFILGMQKHAYLGAGLIVAAIAAAWALVIMGVRRGWFVAG